MIFVIDFYVFGKKKFSFIYNIYLLYTCIEHLLNIYSIQ